MCPLIASPAYTIKITVTLLLEDFVFIAASAPEKPTPPPFVLVNGEAAWVAADRHRRNNRVGGGVNHRNTV